MTEEEKKLAREYAEKFGDDNILHFGELLIDLSPIRKESFIAGLEAGRPKWHKVFENEPYCYEYWDLPQDNLPKIEDFYFVKLKNGFIKICELKYDHWSRKKCFYNLHGGKQSDVAEWLDYPTCDKE